MDFAAAPRCQKVFDFGKSIPDPVYGGASVVQALTMGMWNAQKFHDKTDSGMLEQHARVHQALLEEGLLRSGTNGRKRPKPYRLHAPLRDGLHGARKVRDAGVRMLS